ncbi:hypothetical protein BJY01DRAFT_245045 [Aspergillus pseudoustus]|uniref:Heterokaryon incompatibility domain-containing protein n=1 Tax=Aspergillus pseudoustus TaxID=1810923 RepID=A0ABR4KGZ2_9EURO
MDPDGSTQARKKKQLAAGQDCRSTVTTGPASKDNGVVSDEQEGSVRVESFASGAPSPLSRVIKETVEVPPPSREHIHWHTLRGLLYLLRFGSAKSPDRDPAVLRKLDRAQKCVLALLEEWWTERPHDSAMPQIKQCLFDLAFASASSTETVDSHLAALDKLAAEEDALFLLEAAKRNRERLVSSCSKKHIPEPSMIDVSRDVMAVVESIAGFDAYHKNLIQLYLHDLNSFTISSDLSEVRNTAVVGATYERMAYHSLIQASSRIADSKHRSRFLDPGEQPRLKDYSQCIPSIINSCHWLGCEEDSDHLPRYLWNVKLKRTVDTAELLDKNILYAIVSHTWGRWREGSAMEDVQGVPWRVPKISLYDVTQLPQIIEQVGFAEPYVWMDLLCIPQDMSVPWQQSACKSELPRQVTIFRNASTAVIWLNDVDSWSNMDKAVSWLGLRFLSDFEGQPSKYGGLCDIDKAFAAANLSSFNACDIATEPVNESAEDVIAVPAAWFSSLWTLQEIMIRPDMILLDRHWRPLVVGDKLAVTLDNLLRITGEYSGVDDVPEGIAMLRGMFEDQHMFLLLGANRLTPLVCGLVRTSTSPRAPAIMSAMGATNWFKGRTLEQFQSTEEANALVLSCYPLDFVNEVRSLSGAAFFTCWNYVATMVKHSSTGTEAAQGYPLKGTMLPFMSVPESAGSLLPEPISLEGLPDHPSVGSWTVHSDGSVSLPTVAILASNSIKLQRSCNLKCEVIGNDPMNTTSTYAAFNNALLADWVHKFDGQAHAICTMLSPTRIAGIFLHRFNGTGSFVKAGTFAIGYPFEEPLCIAWTDPESIAVIDVNWHVL